MDEPEYQYESYQVEEPTEAIDTIKTMTGNIDIEQRIRFTLSDAEEINKKVDFTNSVEHQKNIIRSRGMEENERQLDLNMKLITSSNIKEIERITLLQYINYIACASIAAEEKHINLAWRALSRAENKIGFYEGITSPIKSANSEKSKRAAETRKINKDTQRKLLLGYLIDLKPSKKSGWSSKQAAAEAVAKQYLSDHDSSATSPKTPEETLSDLIANLANLLSEDNAFIRAYEA